KAMQRLDTYKGKAALFTWLCTFCRYELSNHHRKHSRIELVPELKEDDPVIRAALESLSLSAAHDPDAACYRDEITRLVQVTLDHLPSVYSDALELKYVHGLSVKEISERLQRGVKATESILTRARQAFKDGFLTISQDNTFSPIQ
ncbi:MAG: sigma-70 family RNA polymerase sigma factor, partial [Pseudomonadota bacterium]